MKRLLMWAAAALLSLLWAHAQTEDVWCLVTDAGHAFAMRDVMCLAAADDDSTFCVVLNDGREYQGVVRATFRRQQPTADTEFSHEALFVQHTLMLTGVDADTPVHVYDHSGRLVMKATAGGADVSALPTGVYILKMNGRTLKFRKP